MTDDNTRSLEAGVRRDFRQAMSYGDYLRLDLVLSAQQPLSDPPRHDELLFIIQHQTSELWLKLMLHELRAVRDQLRSDELNPALKGLARVKHIQHTLIEQWGVLTTLTPSEYAQFRSYLQSSSGFQSWQYRAIEFILGNKNPEMLQVFDHDPEVHGLLTALYEEPTLYDEFLTFLARRGHDIPPPILDRDVRVAWQRAREPRAGVQPDLRALTRVLAGVRGVRGPGRRRGQLPAVAVPAPEDRRADHRVQVRQRRVQRGPVPAQGPRADLLPRALRRSGRDPGLDPGRDGRHPQHPRKDPRRTEVA